MKIWNPDMDANPRNPSDARLQGMARLLIRADREDEEWVFDLIRATRGMAGGDRERLQDLLDQMQGQAISPISTASAP